MKVISLWQPWATLMAAGYKRIETRSWYPSSLRHGQLVAIHAAKHWTEDERQVIEEEPSFQRYLQLSERRGLWSFDQPPLGCVVAIARFGYAVETKYTTYRSFKGKIAPEREATIKLWTTDTERAFGNYAWGRWAWVFSEVRPLQPISLRGQQGIFNWTPPVDLVYLGPRNTAKESSVSHARR